MAKILIIEDQEPLCSLYRTVLRKFDHDAVFATNGESGIAAAQADRPDLIVLDLLLPDMHGTDVAQKLREMSILPGVPLVITTALDEVDAQTIADSLDAAAVLNKPFSVTSIVDCLTSVLEDSGPKALPSGSKQIPA